MIEIQFNQLKRTFFNDLEKMVCNIMEDIKNPDKYFIEEEDQIELFGDIITASDKIEYSDNDINDSISNFINDKLDPFFRKLRDERPIIQSEILTDFFSFSREYHPKKRIDSLKEVLFDLVAEWDQDPFTGEQRELLGLTIDEIELEERVFNIYSKWFDEMLSMIENRIKRLDQDSETKTSLKKVERKKTTARQIAILYSILNLEGKINKDLSFNDTQIANCLEFISGISSDNLRKHISDPYKLPTDEKGRATAEIIKDLEIVKELFEKIEFTKGLNRIKSEIEKHKNSLHDILGDDT